MKQEKLGTIVVGSEDPFNEQQTTLFDLLTYELQDLEPGETYKFPENNYEEKKKMRAMIHAVSKKLRWNNILWHGKNKSYIVTIKHDGLYVRRLG